jgi:hypothetical protein
MKARTMLAGPIVALMFFVIISAQAQTARPAAPSRQQAADAAARKQLAAYMVDFRKHPDDDQLRGKIIELAKTLKPAPLIPQVARTDFAKAAAPDLHSQGEMAARKPHSAALSACQPL